MAARGSEGECCNRQRVEAVNLLRARKAQDHSPHFVLVKASYRSSLVAEWVKDQALALVTAVVQVPFLAQELPRAVGVAKKKKQ